MAYMNNFTFMPFELYPDNQSFFHYNNVPTDPSLVQFPMLIPAAPAAGKIRRNLKKRDPDAEIEVVPCKICGDRSSGVHYGVITCEGCKGFFRRSQTATRPYQCNGKQECVIDRANRNRCQFCRWKKCVELGMSRDAVKFGRMSKKQREKVEGEVNMHKQLNGMGRSKISASDSGSVSDTSDSLLLQNDQILNGPFFQQQCEITPLTANGVSIGNNVVNGYTVFTEMSPVSSGYSSHTSTPAPTNTAPSANIVHAVPVQLSEGTVIIDVGKDNKTATEILTAYLHTSIYSNEQKQQMKSFPLDYDRFWKFANMTKLERWVHGAAQLTPMIHQIVEFAKLLPGFMKLAQEDQIMLLKGGAMDAAIIRMSTLYDLNSDAIIYDGAYLPTSLFNSGDEMEKKFINDLFSFLKELTGYGLTDTETAIFSAMVLAWPSRPKLHNLTSISELYQHYADCLEAELWSNHGDRGSPIFQRLLQLSGTLQNLSVQHIDLLTQFFKNSPLDNLPPLYKEIFLSGQ